MDFFAHQDQARKRTWLLLPLSILSIIGTSVGLYPVICTGIFFALSDEDSPSIDPAIFFNATAFFATTLLVLAIVVCGILSNLAKLRGSGGAGVARRLGGLQVQPNSADVNDRRLLNVVEEMAIASGVPVPPVFLLQDEANINAFAAGWTPRTAVIGVTEGSRQHLSRDELQGVMAHEFSHILNGDMRLNMYLSAVVGGINIIQVFGIGIMEIAGRSAMYGHGYSRSRRDDKNPLAALMIVGFGMMIVGGIGAWFARFTQAAISRQREFLADASAVQFTRNPDGIGNALKKIGAFASYGSLQNPHAATASHLFFANARHSGFAATAMRTHPPLPRRIKRILPSWDGTFPEVAALPASTHPRTAASNTQQFAGEGSLDAPGPSTQQEAARLFTAIPAEGLLEEVAITDDPHIAASKQLLASIPEHWHSAAQDPHDAQAVTLALVMPHPEQRDAQRALIRQYLPTSVLSILDRLLRTRDSDITPAMRLPVAHLTESALRNLSPAQFSAFRNALIATVGADEKIEWFEWCLLRVILDPIEREHTEWEPAHISIYNIRGAEQEAKDLLRLMVISGHDSSKAQAAVWHNNLTYMYQKHWPQGRHPSITSWHDQTNTRPISEVLEALSCCSMNARRDVLLILSRALGHDGKVTVAEAELFAALVAALDAPAAPILAS